MENNNVENVKSPIPIHQPKKSNNIVILIMVLVFIILGFGGYIVYDSFIADNDKKQQEDKTTLYEDYSKENNGSISKLNKFKEDPNYKKFIIQNIDLNGRSISIEIERYNKENIEGYIMRINNVKVSEDYIPSVQILSINVMDDIILVKYHKGMDIAGFELTAYDYKGKIIHNFDIIDKTYEMVIGSINNKNELITIEGKKIIMHGTNMSHGACIILDRETYKEACPCSKELSEYNINDNYIVDAVYEAEYLGNYKFSEPKMTESILLKNEKNFNSYNCDVTNTSNYELIYDGVTKTNKIMNNVALGENKININLVDTGLGWYKLYINGEERSSTTSDKFELFVFNDVLMLEDNNVVGFDNNGNKIFVPSFPFSTNFELGSKKLGKDLNDYKKVYVRNNILYVYVTIVLDTNPLTIGVPNTAATTDFSECVAKNYDWTKSYGGLTKDTKVEALYKFYYLGNYKFSDAIEVESITLNSFLNYCE